MSAVRTLTVCETEIHQREASLLSKRPAISADGTFRMVITQWLIGVRAQLGR